MKDMICRRDSRLKVSDVLGTIKERLVEHRFNIDHYDHKNGYLRGRRNTLDRMVLGLYRNIEVEVTRERKEKDMTISLCWGGLLIPNIVTFIFTFLVSYAVFKGQGTDGLIISIPVGFFFVLINLSLFAWLRYRLISTIRRDLRDLEKEARKKGGKGRIRK